MKPSKGNPISKWWNKQSKNNKYGYGILLSMLGFVLITSIVVASLTATPAETKVAVTSPQPTTAPTPTAEPTKPIYTTSDAINKVKNYEGETGWTIQDAIDSSFSLAESTGTLVITEGWSATQIDNNNFKVVYTYEEDVYGGYGDLIERTIEFKINMETNSITPLDSMADDMLGIANGN